MDFKLSGWPADYPKHNPKDQIEFFLNDLLELEKDRSIASSHLWLSKFAKNSIALEKELIAFQESKNFSTSMKNLLNWIESSTEEDKSFSEIIFEVKNTHYKRVMTLEKFIKSLLKDKHGLKGLVSIARKSIV